MPNASNRPKSGKAAKTLGGAAASTNETPVSTTPETDGKARAQVVGPIANTRNGDASVTPLPGEPGRGPDDHTSASGRDHPSESEQPKPLEKRNGETARRVEQDAHHRKFTQSFDLRQKGARGPKPGQKSKGR
ncbi:MAG: hypothetical protein SGJ21_06680 [Alphaproteobacteria bacterium]|nr:hypothetical protein [Alphaproteobacteria bacterium]